MKNHSFFIGIDVSKETLDFTLIVTNSVQLHIQVTNDKQGIELFIKQAKGYIKSNQVFVELCYDAKKIHTLDS